MTPLPAFAVAVLPLTDDGKIPETMPDKMWACVVPAGVDDASLSPRMEQVSLTLTCLLMKADSIVPKDEVPA